LLDQSRLALLPTKPGVYIFLNEKGKPVYIGKAKNLKKRVLSYFTGKNLEAKTLELLKETTGINHIVVMSEVEAFLLEANLIKKFKPFYNTRLSDDKFFPYLKISKEKIPYVIITRKVDDKNALYFGPYTNVSDLKIVLRLLRRIFPFHSVKNHPKRRCLNGHIGLCPCVTVFPEQLYEYKKNIRNLIKFLKGEKEKVVNSLRKELKRYVKQEAYERAGLLQKKIEKIGFITGQNFDPFAYQQRPDFYYQKLEKELESLKSILIKYGIFAQNLERIECYDISNIQGRDASGSMVVFLIGEASQQDYRKFKIRFKKTPDDYAMLEEVMKRRLKHTEWAIPNLMVIDGGKGQVSAVLQVLESNKTIIPVIGLAKREEIIVMPIGQGEGLNEFREIKLPKSTPGVNLLRRIRDEAHRFALAYHKILRKKALNI